MPFSQNMIARTEAAAPPGLGVLVIDDDSFLLRTLADILRRKGYAPQTASSAGEGLAMLASSDAGPAIAVVDLALPDMNGIELIHRLRDLSRLTEVVILTGHASLDSAVAALREESYDYLLKPVPPEQLLDTLHRAGERWRRRQAEESLRQSEERFRLLVENISDVVVVTDHEGVVQYGNQRLQAAIAAGSQDLLGVDLMAFVHPGDAEAARALLRTPSAEPAEIRVRQRDGGWRLFACRSAELVESSRVAGVVLLAQDVTDRRRLEAQAQQAQKLDSIGRLAGGVAHDFNNLLTVVLGYSEVALAHPALPADLRELLEAIHGAGERGTALTGQLLAFARRKPVAARLLDLNEVVRGLEPLLRSSLGSRVTLVLDLDPAGVLVRADPSQIDQVVMNLTLNGRDAMPHGGPLTIGTGTAPAPRAGERHTAGERLGVLTVSDAGTGMDEATRARLFEPFFTTKLNGSGLGLPTVYGIVHQAGGHLSVESVLGAGTTVEVYLPLARELENGAPRAPLVPPGHGETVLVVDDEPAITQLVCRMLEGQGYGVATASTPAEAIRMVESGEVRPQVLLTDRVMPGMGGEEVARRIHELLPDLPVIFMSGYSDAAAPGEKQVLNKPLSPLAVVTAIRKALHRS